MTTLKAVEATETAARAKLFTTLQAELEAKYPLTPSTLELHNTEASPWLLIDGKVYDCTQWQTTHPAGPKPIIRSSGNNDATTIFNQVHSASAKRMLAKFCLGPMWETVQGVSDDPAASPTTESSPSSTSEISPEEAKPLTVAAVETLTHNTKRLTVTFKDASFVLPMICGGHISVTVPVNGGSESEEVFRSYSPVIIEPGSFSFVVKLYDHGKGSQYLHSVKPGDFIAVRGPIQPAFSLESAVRRGRKRLIAIGAGTGMAPIVSIAREALEQGVGVVLFACFRNLEDVLFMDLVHGLKVKYDADDVTRGLFRVHLVFSQEKRGSLEKTSMKWSVDSVTTGERINAAILKGKGNVDRPWVLEEAVVCGPIAFNEACVAMLREPVGFLESQITAL